MAAGYIGRTLLGSALSWGKSLFSGGSNLSADALGRLSRAGVLRDGTEATATHALNGLGGSTVMSRFLKFGGIAGAADVLLNGKDGLVGGAMNSLWTQAGVLEAEQNTTGKWHGLYKNIAFVLDLLGIQNTRLNQWVDDKLATTARKNSEFQDFSDNPLGYAAANPGTTAILGGLGLAVSGLGSRLVGATTGIASHGWNAVRGLGGAAAAGPALSSAGGFLSRIPVVGKWLGAAAILGTGIAAGSTADASTVQAGSGDITAPADSLAAEGAALGLSIVGTRTAIQAAAPLAASLGIKAIPGIASIYAAGEAIYDTAKHAIRGEFAQAGTRLVAGVGETVAGIGGAATYFTLGTAWREAVRAGGAAIFGQERAIEHSAVVQLGSLVRDSFTGAANNTGTSPAPAPARAPDITRDMGFAMS